MVKIFAEDCNIEMEVKGECYNALSELFASFQTGVEMLMKRSNGKIDLPLIQYLLDELKKDVATF